MEKNNMDVYIHGIQCDNPNCDFKDKTVKYEDYPKWVNKPCPKCGCNLLTEKDYNICKAIVSITKLFNKLPHVKGKRKKIRIKTNGNGINEIIDEGEAE